MFCYISTPDSCPRMWGCMIWLFSSFQIVLKRSSKVPVLLRRPFSFPMVCEFGYFWNGNQFHRSSGKDKWWVKKRALTFFDFSPCKMFWKNLTLYEEVYNIVCDLLQKTFHQKFVHRNFCCGGRRGGGPGWPFPFRRAPAAATAAALKKWTKRLMRLKMVPLFMWMS